MTLDYLLFCRSAARQRTLAVAVLATAILAVSRGAETGRDLPDALYTDPAPDTSHLAASAAVQFESHGGLLNAEVYRPSGAGSHPTAILFHGLPGNEQNLDLAQAVRRAGWTVITFHYTGSWRFQKMARRFRSKSSSHFVRSQMVRQTPPLRSTAPKSANSSRAAS